MYSTSANSFGHPNQATRATATRSRSIERRTDMPPQGQGKGYGWAVYQDYLILFGSNGEETRGTFPCVYNLKEQRPEELGEGGNHLSVVSWSPCFYHQLNGILFYCAGGDGGRGMRFGNQP